MSPTSSSSSPLPLILLTAAVTVTSTAGLTYWWTKRTEERRYLDEKQRAYDRDALLKRKTLQARQRAANSKDVIKGTLLKDVHIDKVYFCLLYTSPSPRD